MAGATTTTAATLHYWPFFWYGRYGRLESSNEHKQQKRFDQHKSAKFVKLFCVIITKIYPMLDNIIVDYRPSSYVCTSISFLLLL